MNIYNTMNKYYKYKGIKHLISYINKNLEKYENNFKTKNSTTFVWTVLFFRKSGRKI
jgi:hypothetical protein